MGVEMKGHVYSSLPTVPKITKSKTNLETLKISQLNAKCTKKQVSYMYIFVFKPFSCF